MLPKPGKRFRSQAVGNGVRQGGDGLQEMTHPPGVAFNSASIPVGERTSPVHAVSVLGVLIPIGAIDVLDGVSAV